MSAYRFCRSDDIALLVDALNRCWSPYFPGEPPLTPARFKRSIRDFQVWCSSCMVAFSGADPIGVVIGAKRLSGTLIHKIAVHPDHVRQGHARHMLTSLSSKLAILGPPRLVAEVPATSPPGHGLFAACGYVEEAVLTDYELSAVGRHFSAADVGRFVIPVTVDDLAANGLLEEEAYPRCWERSLETITARKDDLTGLAVASEDRIEAYLLYSGGPGGQGDGEPGSQTAEIVALRSFIEDDGARLSQLLSRLRTQGALTVRIPKVHPAEIATELLETLGFRPDGAHGLYAAIARSG